MVPEGDEPRNAGVQFYLGEIYATGDDLFINPSVSKDEAEAIKWYRRAAEQGHDYAQFRLGEMYVIGIGVTKNDDKAMCWYRKAAENKNGKGSRMARFRLKEPLINSTSIL